MPEIITTSFTEEADLGSVWLLALPAGSAYSGRPAAGKRRRVHQGLY